MVSSSLIKSLHEEFGLIVSVKKLSFQIIISKTRFFYRNRENFIRKLFGGLGERVNERLFVIHSLDLI